MRDKFLVFFIFIILFFSFIEAALSKTTIKFELSDNSGQTNPTNTIVVSGSYQPYHSITLTTEVTGKIVKMNIDEGEIVPKGKTYWYIDCVSLKDQVEQIKDSLCLLKKEHKILLDILNLREKTLNRYKILYERHRIPEQTLNNIQLEYLASLNAVIANEQQQHQLILSLIKLKDNIKKSGPILNRSYYVSQLYHFTNEYVNVGEPIAKLLDISKARVKLILSPSSFIKLRNWIKDKVHLVCFIKKDQGSRWIRIKKFHFERVKIDPANGYLYSYSADIVFKPIPNFLWGQVIKVRLVYNP